MKKSCNRLFLLDALQVVKQHVHVVNGITLTMTWYSSLAQASETLVEVSITPQDALPDYVRFLLEKRTRKNAVKQIGDITNGKAIVEMMTSAGK